MKESVRRDAQFRNQLSDIVEILRRLEAGKDGGDLPDFGNLRTFSAKNIEPTRLGILSRTSEPSREVAGSLRPLVDGWFSTSNNGEPGVLANHPTLPF